MLRRIVLVICLGTLTGCPMTIEELAAIFDSYYVVFSPSSTLSQADTVYFNRMLNGAYPTSTNSFDRYRGGIFDVSNNKLNAMVMMAPAPDEKFIEWKSGEGYLYPGSKDTVVSLSTTALNGPDWKSIFDDPNFGLSLAPVMKMKSSAEMAAESTASCLPYALLTPDTMLKQTHELYRDGAVYTVTSNQWSTSFKKVGANSARVELMKTSRILDENKNQLLTDRSTQRLGVTWPVDGGLTPNVKLYYERTDTEFASGEKQVSVVVFPAGITQYRGDLTLLNSTVTESGGGRLFQGATGPASQSDYVNFTYRNKFTHNRSGYRLSMSLDGGSRQNAYSCGQIRNERLDFGQGQVIERTIEENFTGNDSMGYLTASSTSTSGGFVEGLQLKAASVSNRMTESTPPVQFRFFF